MPLSTIIRIQFWLPGGLIGPILTRFLVEFSSLPEPIWDSKGGSALDQKVGRNLFNTYQKYATHSLQVYKAIFCINILLRIYLLNSCKVLMLALKPRGAISGTYTTCYITAPSLKLSSLSSIPSV